MDYVLPQAYWHIGHEKADYKKIADWWAVNNFNTNLFIGQGIHRLGREKENKAWGKRHPTEIEKQLILNKSIPQIQGTVFFSAKTFLKNPFGLNQVLRTTYFKNPILPPIVNKTNEYIPEPVFNVKLSKLKKGKYKLSWESLPENKEKEAVKFLVYQFDGIDKTDVTNFANIISLTGEKQVIIPKKKVKKATIFLIQSVSRNNNISNPVKLIK